MNRTIKFRGRLEETDKIIFFELGDLSSDSYGFYSRNYDDYVVDIVQLIAVDINGNEIYEGDFCICKGAIINPFQATFDHFTAIRDGKIILKEAQS